MILSDWLPGLPVALPLLVAAVLIGGAPILHDRVANTLAISIAAMTTACCAALLVEASHQTIVYWFGGWQPRDGIALGISFTIDRAGAGLATFTGVLVTTALVYAASYFRNIGTLFHGLMLVFLAAMVGFCLTGDLFNLFVFFELMSVTAYALTGYKVEERGPIQGALNFAMSNSLGAFLVLLGIGLLYGRTGALNLAQIGRAVSAQTTDGLVLVAFAFIAIGLCVKAAILPFHFWLADAHAVAPTPVCVLFSGVMVELGLYGLLRVYWTIFSDVGSAQGPGLQTVWLVAGLVTALVGGVMCYLQRHLKRLLAFSTVSHAGAFLVGAASLSATGLAGTMVYVLGHGLVKAALFMVAGVLLDRLGSVDEIELRGQGRRFLPAGVMFGLGGLALAGAPLFLSTTGKSLVEEAFHDRTGVLVTIVLAVSSILTGGAILRATLRVFWGWGQNADGVAARAPTHGQEARESRDEHPTGTPWGMLLPPAVLLASAIGLAVVSTPLGQMESVAHELMDRPASAALVLDGVATPRMTSEELHPSMAGVTVGIVSTLGAAVLAAVALGAVRLPVGVSTRTTAIVNAAAVPLRSLHSGHIGDYAAWLLLGALVFGCAYSLVLRS